MLDLAAILVAQVANDDLMSLVQNCKTIASHPDTCQARTSLGIRQLTDSVVLFFRCLNNT